MSIELLRSKLAAKSKWIETRYNYYEQKHLKLDPSPMIPARERFSYNSTLGWCTKAVDTLVNKLSVDSFENDNFNMWNIYQMNNFDILFDSAIKSALISACCFIYISAGEDGEPRLQVIDGRHATGTIDPITGLLTEGYAILDVDDYGAPEVEAYFTDEYTEFIYSGNNHEVIMNPTGYPLLVPIIYRPDAKRPFGQSRISKACMDIMDKARFTVTRLEVASEYAAIPQKYVLGLAQNADFDTVKNSYKAILAIDKDEDGDKPVVGQFQQMSLNSLIEQLRTYASSFAGETGLTLDDLGYITSNPSSAEAIRAGHAMLENTAIKAQATLGSGFLNAGFVASCLRDEAHYKRSMIYQTKVIWKPLFPMDNASISSFGDGMIKLSQAMPEAVTAELIRRMTGLPIEV